MLVPSTASNSWQVMRTRRPASVTLPSRMAHAEVAADLRHVDGPALVGEGRIAGDDRNQRHFDSAVMMSSVIPSTK